MPRAVRKFPEDVNFRKVSFEGLEGGGHYYGRTNAVSMANLSFSIGS